MTMMESIRRHTKNTHKPIGARSLPQQRPASLVF
jgi:hypothetical protein